MLAPLGTDPSLGVAASASGWRSVRGGGASAPRSSAGPRRASSRAAAHKVESAVSRLVVGGEHRDAGAAVHFVHQESRLGTGVDGPSAEGGVPGTGRLLARLHSGTDECSHDALALRDAARGAQAGEVGAAVEPHVRRLPAERALEVGDHPADVVAVDVGDDRDVDPRVRREPCLEQRPRVRRPAVDEHPPGRVAVAGALHQQAVTLACREHLEPDGGGHATTVGPPGAPRQGFGWARRRRGWFRSARRRADTGVMSGHLSQ
jgi:hypothetical protein